MELLQDPVVAADGFTYTPIYYAKTPLLRQNTPATLKHPCYTKTPLLPSLRYCFSIVS